MFFNIIVDCDISYKFNNTHVDGRGRLTQTRYLPMHVLHRNRTNGRRILRRHPSSTFRELGPCS